MDKLCRHMFIGGVVVAVLSDFMTSLATSRIRM
jgi:hypothetical protein